MTTAATTTTATTTTTADTKRRGSGTGKSFRVDSKKRFQGQAILSRPGPNVVKLFLSKTTNCPIDVILSWN